MGAARAGRAAEAIGHVAQLARPMGLHLQISTVGLPRGRTHWLRSNNQPTAPAVTKAKIGSAPASTRATTTISIAIAIRNARTGLSMAAAATINHMTQEEVCLSEDRALTLTVGYLAPRRSVSRPTRVTCGARPLFTSRFPFALVATTGRAHSKRRSSRAIAGVARDHLSRHLYSYG